MAWPALSKLLLFLLLPVTNFEHRMVPGAKTRPRPVWHGPIGTLVPGQSRCYKGLGPCTGLRVLHVADVAAKAAC